MDGRGPGCGKGAGGVGDGRSKPDPRQPRRGTGGQEGSTIGGKGWGWWGGAGRGLKGRTGGGAGEPRTHCSAPPRTGTGISSAESAGLRPRT